MLRALDVSSSNFDGELIISVYIFEFFSFPSFFTGLSL